MKLLFGKEGNPQGAKELKEITGSYYENNDFSRIKTDLKLETEKIIELISPEVYQLAEDFYYAEASGGIDRSELLEHIQLPIALMSVFKFYQSNLVSHEGTGRKNKIDKENETLSWEWMIDRDDEAHERKAFDAIDRLIRFLDKSNLTEWVNSASQKSTRDLFVNTTTTFNNVYPIDNSGRFYYSVVPFLAEIQRKRIAKVLGSVKYAQVLAWHKQPGTDPQSELALENSIIITFVQQAMPLLAMELAVKRFSIRLLPYSVAQEFKSMMQGRQASQVALDSTMRKFTQHLTIDAEKALNELKLYLNANDPDAAEYDLLPENPSTQKFFRT